jgi:hypothetical protein
VTRPVCGARQAFEREARSGSAAFFSEAGC